MKRLILLILAFLLASCSINRKVTKSEKIQAESIAAIDTHTSIFDYKNILDSISLNINATIRLYDTSRPADSLGNRPVLADIVIEGNSTNVKREEDNRTEETHTTEKKHDTYDEETNETKDTKTKDKSFIFFAIGLIFISAAIVIRVRIR